MTTKLLSRTWKVKLLSLPILVRRVVGDSMLPTYRKGQIVIAVRWRKPRVDSIVVVNVDGREVIKRVTKTQDGQVWLEGDNPKVSTDSRRYGWIDKSETLGVVILPLR